MLGYFEEYKLDYIHDSSVKELKELFKVSTKGKPKTFFRKSIEISILLKP